MDGPRDLRLHDPEFESWFGGSFAEIVMIKKSRKKKKLFSESSTDRNEAGSGPQSYSDFEEFHRLLLLLNHGPVLQEPTIASPEFEL